MSTPAISTPVFDTLLGEVVHSAHVARTRLAEARAGVDRLHAPDAHERCLTCRVAHPCPTVQLVDGLTRGELSAAASQELVDDALRVELAEAGEEAPVPSSVPAFADLLGGARTGKALDVLLGGGRT